MFARCCDQAVHENTNTANPETKITASCGEGGHFPPLVGAIRVIHLGASFRSFQFKWDSSSSSFLLSVLLLLAAVVTVVPLFACCPPLAVSEPDSDSLRGPPLDVPKCLCDSNVVGSVS